MMHDSQTDPQKRMSAFLTSLMFTCDQTAELMSQALDEKLTWFSRLGVGLHTMFCRFCRRYRRHLLLMRSILGPSAPDASVAQDSHVKLTDPAKARIHDAIMKFCK